MIEEFVRCFEGWWWLKGRRDEIGLIENEYVFVLRAGRSATYFYSYLEADIQYLIGHIPRRYDT